MSRTDRNIEWCNNIEEFDWELYEELCEYAEYYDEEE